MANPYYDLMINNAKAYLSNADSESPETINAFEISAVIAICTGKLKEEVIVELL